MITTFFNIKLGRSGVDIKHVVFIFGTCFKYAIVLFSGFKYIVVIVGHILSMVQY